MNIGDRESTKLVLEVVEVAENNGLKLPREFGLLLKQVSSNCIDEQHIPHHWTDLFSKLLSLF